MSSGTNFGKGAKDNTHRSRWGLVNDISDRLGTVYKQGENGCCHNDKDSWQSECNGVYLTNKFRDGLKAKNQDNKLIDETCYVCNAMIMKQPPVAGFEEYDNIV